MQIIKGGRNGAQSELRSGTFTGTVWGDPVLSETDGVTINNVWFAPSSRTYWHTHGGGQILIVIAGAGNAYDREGNGGPLISGDMVYIPPEVEHWHGATEDSMMLHTAITLQGHVWLAEVTDDEYRHRGDGRSA